MPGNTPKPENPEDKQNNNFRKAVEDYFDDPLINWPKEKIAEIIRKRQARAELRRGIAEFETQQAISARVRPAGLTDTDYIEAAWLLSEDTALDGEDIGRIIERSKE
jgi:hypothetical protein